MGKVIDKIRRSTAWKSIFRSGSIKSNLGRSLLIFNNVFLHVLPVKVKEDTLRFGATFYLGITSFFLFIILVVTGIVLMLYYHPSIPQAYWDMKDLQFVVSNGVFLRNMHRWAAHGMVASVFLHMLRVFYAGAFRPPKQFNWVIGVILFVLTLQLSYTGYLLPWDQLAYWAVSVGANMAGAAPVFGEQVKFLLLGGNAIAENTLIRFYVLHCVILPFFVTMLLGIHFWRVRKDGGIKPLIEKETNIKENSEFGVDD